MIRKIEKLIILAVFLVVSICVSAQDGTYGAYSPYSVYGIGDISKEGTAYNKTKGGTGIATRNRKFINYLNPAAVTARDSLSFMADFGLAPSKSEARRLVMQGGVALDGEKITDPKAMLTREALSNEPVLKKGKKNFYKIIIK